jgi:hypothetical protein
MSDIYHTLLAYTATSSSEATGYTDDNLSLRSVRREWRSGTLPLTDATIILNLGSSKVPAALLIWGTNILTSGSGNSIAADYSTNGTDYSALGTVTIIKNAAGRRAALIPVAQTAQYLKLTYSAATTYDSMTYASIGRIVVMTTKITACFSKPFNFTRQIPNVSQQLVNGRPAIVETGEGYATFSLTTQDDFGDVDYQTVFEKLAAGPCVLDAGTSLGAFLIESSDWKISYSISLPMEETSLSVMEVV